MNFVGDMEATNYAASLAGVTESWPGLSDLELPCTRPDPWHDVSMNATIEQSSVELTDVVRYFVESGRVVPGIEIDGISGRARTWWWPLPSAEDRELLASLVRAHGADDTTAGHRLVARRLGDSVDAEVRRRLLRNGTPTARRGGRLSVHETWMRSLTSADPWMPISLDPGSLTSFATEVTQWVQGGAAALGRSRLALRVCEPDEGDTEQRWWIALLVQDAEEPSLVVEIERCWTGEFPLHGESMLDLLASLGRMANVAPELAPMMDDAKPTGIHLSSDRLLEFVSTHIEPLGDVGIEVFLPSWWTRRGRIKLRAKAKGSTSRSNPGGGPAGFGLQELVSFSWEAALGDIRLTKADLQRLQRTVTAKQSLVRVRGAWVAIDKAEIETLLRYVGTTSEATAAEMLRTALGLEGIVSPAGIEIEGVEATGWLGSMLDDALHSTVMPIPSPEGFEGTLRAYQARGVGWLAFLGRLGLGACLADDMGLGKTAQMIATLLADPVEGPTLVLCPVSVLGNWARELERFAPQLQVMVHHGTTRTDKPQALATADVVLSTYSVVARDIETLRAVDWSRLVLDEAQQIKNPGTSQTRAVRALSASRRIALTGTPVENRLTELWSIMHVLNPGLLGNLTAFKKSFATPIEKHSDPEATELLRRVTAPFVLRRLKSDRSIIDDLPEKIEMTEHCPLTSEQATLYQAVVDELIEASERSDGIERKGLVLAGIGKLKQVCNHPAHFLGDGSALGGRSGKLERVEELIDEILSAREKVLCFTQYAEWGSLLVPYFTRRFGFEPLWLHGGVTRRNRDLLVHRFATDDEASIFLLSLKAGGTGLNLTTASHVIHLDRWWNPAVEDQATDRAYRIGQKRTVLVHKLVSSGTIEERLDEMIKSKRTLAGKVVGSGEQWLTELSTDELRSAIALRPSDSTVGVPT
jgi:SNF2-related domain/SNF2 Helicase protein/Helicase conserved C-terminal domain